MDVFCFGNYAKLIKTAASLTNEEAVNGLFDLVNNPFHSYEEWEDEERYIKKEPSELLSCKKNVLSYVRKDAMRDAVKSTAAQNFSEKVLKKIPDEKKAPLVSAVSGLISRSENLPDTDAKRLLALAEKDAAAFLAETFLTTLQYPNDWNKTPSHERRSGKKTIWDASRRFYAESVQEGRRFDRLNRAFQPELLPCGKEGGSILPLREILDGCAPCHMFVTGEGGVGKTAFLFNMMKNAYDGKYSPKNAVPVFIALNRCPPRIGAWYSPTNGGTNFIYRYIAAQITGGEMEDAPKEILERIQSEFNKPPVSDKSPEYLLLLDGLNEVSRGAETDIPYLLLREIKAMMRCKNIRVIMVSRKTEDARLTGDGVKTVELTGLREENIRHYLSKKNYSPKSVSEITGSAGLVECLRVPLFLRMFAAQKKDGASRALTRGEILYRYFNHDGGAYTEKTYAGQRSPLSPREKLRAWFALDFLLPRVGWEMEQSGVFGVSKAELRRIIDTSLDSGEGLGNFWNGKVIVFPEYETDSQGVGNIKDAWKRLGSGAALDCIVNTLGVMYRDDKFTYYFIHHYFRDYFAAFFEIQHMRIARAFHGADLYEDAVNALSRMDNSAWSETKRGFIGEILGEHKNAPVTARGKGNLLRIVLNIYRQTKAPVKYSVFNVIETLKAARVNLAGEDFSGLDLSDCRLHGVACSAGRGENRLAADFSGAKISDETFLSDWHTKKIITFSYSQSGGHLTTVSEDNTAKRWDVNTGRCEGSVLIKDVAHPQDEKEQTREFVFNDDPGSLDASDYMGFRDKWKKRMFLQKRYQEESQLPSFDVNERLSENFVFSNSGGAFLVIRNFRNSYTEKEKTFVSEYDFTLGNREYGTEGFERAFAASYSPDGEHAAVVYGGARSRARRLAVYKKHVANPVSVSEIPECGNLLALWALNEKECLFLYHTAPREIIHIALFNAASGELRALFTDTDALPDGFGYAPWDAPLHPPFCIDAAHKKIVLWKHHCLRIIALDGPHCRVTDRPFPGDCPRYPDNRVMFARGDDDLLLMFSHKNECTVYSVKEERVRASVKLDGFILPYETPTFPDDFNGCRLEQSAGRHGGRKLLSRDGSGNIYEYDLDTATAAPRYGYGEKSGLRFYLKTQTGEFMVSRFNKFVCVIDSKSGRLIESLSHPDDAQKERLLRDAVKLSYFDFPASLSKNNLSYFIFEKSVIQFDRQTLRCSKIFPRAAEGTGHGNAHEYGERLLYAAVLPGEGGNFSEYAYRKNDDGIYEYAFCRHTSDRIPEGPLLNFFEGGPSRCAAVTLPGNEDALVIKIADDCLLFCDLKTETAKPYRNYTPGLIVTGCNFKGAQLSGGTRELIACHGGMF
ncbi:MAG: NACHT domain-containing protein [Clostridiales bacterium]|jgi:hypothetical protein|nr:NACHT domain-containing protein [Clostridiales bacterium]